MMKEWYWFVIFAIIILTAFTPLLLGNKCPNCGKRKLTEKNPNLEKMKQTIALEPYTYFFICAICDHAFKRVKSQPLEKCSEAEQQFLVSAGE